MSDFFSGFFSLTFCFLALFAISFYHDKCRLKNQILSAEWEKKEEAARSAGYDQGLRMAAYDLRGGLYDPDARGHYNAGMKYAQAEYNHDFRS